MIARQQSLACLTCTTCHDEVFTSLVKQVNVRMLVVKGCLYLLHYFCQQLFLIKYCRKAAAHFSRDGQLFRAAVHTLEHGCQLTGHAVESSCQPADLVLRRDLG